MDSPLILGLLFNLMGPESKYREREVSKRVKVWGRPRVNYVTNYINQP